MMTYALVSAVNDDGVLASCLRASPEVCRGEVAVIERRGFTSPAAAYNPVLEGEGADVLVFVHQDMYLPDGWMACLRRAVGWLALRDASWGVLGVYGVTAEGEGVGWTYSTGLGRVVGRPFAEPRVVRTLDEVVLVVRRTSGLRFGAGVAGFHMYGTDLCLEAEQRGLKNYVFPALAIHNSNGIRQLPWAFWRTYLHVRRQWWDRLPVVSPCVRVARSPWPMVRTMLERQVAYSMRRRVVGTRVADPAAVFAALQAAGAAGPSGDGGRGGAGEQAAMASGGEAGEESRFCGPR